MSALVCALSGEVPNEPVVSTKSGLLFERKLITKYVEVRPQTPLLRDAPPDLFTPLGAQRHRPAPGPLQRGLARVGGKMPPVLFRRVSCEAALRDASVLARGCVRHRHRDRREPLP
jgi:hypothetical protein